MLSTIDGETHVSFNVRGKWVTLSLDLYLFYVSRCETQTEMENMLQAAIDSWHLVVPGSKPRAQAASA